MNQSALSDEAVIAVCGMGLRLPGGINTPSALYKFLVSGEDARALPDVERYNAHSFTYTSADSQTRTLPAEGYWLDWAEVTGWDPSVFSAIGINISQTEMKNLDPQQRILLRVVWEALESAAENDWQEKASRIGCYVGSFADDWREMHGRDSLDTAKTRLLGYTDFALSNRISHVFGFGGPSMTVRVACAAAGLALHLACQAIRAGECDAAVVAGSNIILSPDFTLFMAEQGILSPNASCRSFDAQADGYARAEAVNCLYIKRHDLAVRDGNPVRAIIRGSATNADGKTAGMSTPSSEAQEKLIRSAYKQAGIRDSEMLKTAMVECHGPATLVGDAVETCVIAKIFGERGILIGSAKPALGHAEGASAIVSIMKAILSLENRIILPNIKFESPNLQIPFKAGKLTVPIMPLPWPDDRLERISINNFGIGGTNVHIILDSANSKPIPGQSQKSTSLSTPFTSASYLMPRHKRKPTLLLFSAASEDSLQRMVELHKTYYNKHPERLERLAYTLTHRRLHLSLRTFSVVDEFGNFHSAGTSHKCYSRSQSVVFIFSGLGSQWARMGVELLKFDSGFLEDIKTMDDVLQQLPSTHRPSWSIQGELVKAESQSRLGDPEYGLPVLAAFQIALVKLLGRYRIYPAAVLGHSSGEIAAAYAAGALTFEDAVRIAYYGGFVRKQEDKQSNVKTTCHLVQMKEASDKYCSFLQTFLRPRRPKMDFYSSVSGQLMKNDADLGPCYWRQNMASPVLLRQATESLLVGSSSSIYVEIGPGSALSEPLRQAYAETGVSKTYISIMSRGLQATTTVLCALGELHSRDVAVDFPVTDKTVQPLSDLAPYPWHLTKNHWSETRVMTAWRMRACPPHELLGIRSPDDSDILATWRCMFSIDKVLWMRDHCIGSDIIFPAVAYISMAGEIARQLTGADQEEAYIVRGLSIKTALVLIPGRSVEIQTWARRERAEKSQWWEFSVQSYSEGAWSQHCTGMVKSGRASHGSNLGTAHGDRDEFFRVVDAAIWYRAMSRVGHNYGSEFTGMEDIVASVSSPSVKLRVKDARRVGGQTCPKGNSTPNSYIIHPTTIDKAIQSLIVAKHFGQPRLLRQRYLPTNIEEIIVGSSPKSGDRLQVEAVITASNDAGCRGSVAAYATYGSDRNPVFSVTNLRFATGDSEDVKSESHGAIQMVWKPDIDLLNTAPLLNPQSGPRHVETQELLEALCLLCVAEMQDAVKGIADDTKDCPAHLRKLVAWQKCYLSRHQGSPTLTCNSRARGEQMRRICDILQHTPASAAAELMLRGASNAALIFTGSTSPLALFLQDNALHRLYDWMNSLWSYESFTELICHQRGNHLRVLEIGAGTGGLTARMLQCLQSSTEDCEVHGAYVFTDISAGFFPAAKERFKDFHGVEYRVLDITRDPISQGFKGDYDLVIASNVLHATPNLTQTLRHVRSLLKPDGRLLLQELACETKWINLIMGFLPGWWLGESDERASEPYISAQLWNERLRLANFSPLESVVLDAKPPHQINATMIARPAVRKCAQERHVTLICGAVDINSALVEELEMQLRCMLFKVTRAELETAKAVPPGNVISLLDLSPAGAFLDEFTQSKLDGLLNLLNNIKETNSALLWLTRPCQIYPTDPRFSPILGIARTVRQEMGVNFATLELESEDSKAIEAVCKVLEKVSSTRCNETGYVDPDKEFAYISKINTIVIPRCTWISVRRALNATRVTSDITSRVLHVSRPGRLDSLEWVLRDEASLDMKLSPGMVHVRIEAAGLNFKDVLVAMGIESTRGDGVFLGCEGSGTVMAIHASVSRVKVGDRVMVFAPHARCFATAVQISEHLCASIPDGLSFNDAAGMPCVFITVLRALADKARLAQGQTILIHSAAGGVGIAAIQIARWLGAQVYATVGSEAKVEFLQSAMGMPRGHIFHSRDEGFAREVMVATEGRGVDVVLNSLAGELLNASWRCVAPCGTFIELGKHDVTGSSKLAIGENQAFFSIEMAHLSVCNDSLISQLLDQVVLLYLQGAITPVRPVRVFSDHEIVEAFRYLYAGMHIGKITIDIGGEDVVRRILPTTIPKAVFCPEDVYILVGGLRGLSAAISRWMVSHGARNLAFLSRSAGDLHQDQEGEMLLAELRGMGCKIRAFSCDVADEDAVQIIISRIASTHRIAGLVHLAMVLADAEFGNLTIDKWQAATNAKVAGTWNLHRALSKDMDFFVLVGSMFGITGRVGQANYSSANAFLDSFVQYRQGMGLPASVLDVGFVEDFGTMTRKQDLLEIVKRSGLRVLNEQEVLDGMQLAMARSNSHLGKQGKSEQIDLQSGLFRFCCNAQVSIGFGCTLPLSNPQNNVFWKRDARMAYYSHDDGRYTGSSRNSSPGSSALKDFVRRASDQPIELDTADSAAFLAREIAKGVLSFLMRDEELVDNSLSVSLASFGLDSLMAIELRNWWHLIFGSHISLLQLTSAINFEQLGKLAARQMRERLSINESSH